MKQTNFKSGFGLLRLLLVAAIIGILASLALPARAQSVSRNVKSALGTPIVCLAASTNLPASLLITNLYSAQRHLGITWTATGGDATNAGVCGLQWKIKSAGTNNQVTTSPVFTTTFTATGGTAYHGYAVIPDYTLGPGDAIILSGITNAAVNVGGAASSLTINNVWIESGW